MRVGIPSETAPLECRVAATVDTVERLKKLGFEIWIQRGAGSGAKIPDSHYQQAGAQLVGDPVALWGQVDIILKINPPRLRDDGQHEADLIKPGGLLISMISPAQNIELLDRLASRQVNVIALDRIPRISRAQKMDVLSSMANIAGYRAIIEAANLYGGFFGSQITAAGRTPPAQVLIIGAGVAGLAAIAAARSIGAEVRAFDVRPAVKEQVESLGAEFLLLDFPQEEGETAGGYAKLMSKEFIDAELALFAAQAKEVDIIVTTALIPGRKAPVLITAPMVESMKPGSVIVDLAAAQGGNCEHTCANKVVEIGGVSIIGYTDLTSRLPAHASRFFGTNLCHLLDDMGKAAAHKIDLTDEVIWGSLVAHDGDVRWPIPSFPHKPPAEPIQAEPTQTSKPAQAPAQPEPTPAKPVDHSGLQRGVGLLMAGLVFLAIGLGAPADFIQHFTVFVLACFVGWQVVWSVSASLHTPLMSVTNAISGIIIVGGILQAGSGQTDIAAGLGVVAIFVASINIFGGFLVTRRILQMFHRGES